MRIPCLLLRRRDCSMASNGITCVDVGVGHSGASRFDRIVPTTCLFQVGESTTVSVVHVLRRVGNQRNALPNKSRLRKISCLRTPTADGIAGLLGFRRVDAETRKRRRPRRSSRISMVSPSTTFNTTAVVSSARAVGDGTINGATTAAAIAALATKQSISTRKRCRRRHRPAWSSSDHHPQECHTRRRPSTRRSWSSRSYH